MANELQTIVSQSGLEKSKAQFILERFTEYFDVAAEWEQKAKEIVVTNENQIGIMKMARAGRLFLREKRIAVENARKHLKEQSLREGKAIDGIANILKALIIPIEDHLYIQEHFVELRQKAEEEKKRIEAEQKAETERLAREKAEEKERERIRQDNVRLLKEAEARDAKLKREQAKREKAERARKKAEAEKEQAEEDRKQALAEKVEAETKRKEAEKERKRVRTEQKRKDAELQDKPLIICPFCGLKFRLQDKHILKEGEKVGNHQATTARA